MCDAYAQALGDEILAAGTIHGIVGSDRWTGRSARFVRGAISDWQGAAHDAEGSLRGLASQLRRAAEELTLAQTDWQRRSDSYEAAVRDRARWGRT